MKDKEKVAPRLGPCYNNRLIEWYDPSEVKIVKIEDDEQKEHDPDSPEVPVSNKKDEISMEPKWVCKHTLSAATEGSTGDYRRVNEETWLKFKELYPGSGPAITTVFYNDKKYANNGYYPTHLFKILDPPPNPNVKKQTSWFGWSTSKKETSEPVHNNENNKTNVLIAGGAVTTTATNNNDNTLNRSLLQDRNARTLKEPAVSNPLLYHQHPAEAELETIDLIGSSPAENVPSNQQEELEIQAMKVGILGRDGYDSDDDKDSDDDTFI